MARLKLREVIQDREGVAQASATVYLYNQDTTTPISSTLYADKTGGTTKSNPLTSDASGVVECYVDAPVGRCDLLVTPVVGTPYTLADRSFEADTADLVTLTGTQTLTNKTLTSPVINSPTGDIATKTGTETLTNKTLTSPIVTTLRQAGPDVFYVDAYANFAAALAAIRTAGKGILQFGVGTYLLDDINLTNLTLGVTVRGMGQGTIIRPTGATPKSVFDCLGSLYLTLEDMQIGVYNQESAYGTVPETAILMSQISGGTASNQIRLKNLKVYGSYSKACYANYGVPSVFAQDCQFFNYKDDANAWAVYGGTNNALSFSSANQTITTATFATNELAFRDCEVHEQSGTDGVASVAGTVWLNGASSEWTGGNISTHGPQHVRLTRSSGTVDPRVNIFKGVNFYAEPRGSSDVSSAIYAARCFRMTAAANVGELEVANCKMTAETEFFAGYSAGTFTSLKIRNNYLQGPAPTMLTFGGNNGTLVDPDIDAGGLTVAIGAGGTSTRGIVINAPTFTKGTSTTLEVSAAGALTIPVGATVTSGGLTVTAGGVTATAGDVTVTAGDVKSRHLLGNGSAPTVTASSGWGSGGNAPTVTITGNDSAVRVRIAVAAGATPTANPTVQVNFASAFANTPVTLVEFGATDDGTLAAAIAVGDPPGIVETLANTASVQIQFYYTPLVSKYYEFKFLTVGDV